MTLKWSCMVALAVFAAVAFAQTEAPVNAPGIQKIDMESLLDVPVGSTLLDTGIKRVTQEEGVFQMAVPLEWSEKAKCRAHSPVARIFSGKFEMIGPSYRKASESAVGMMAAMGAARPIVCDGWFS